MAEILRHRWKWCTRHRLCSLRLAEKACEKGDDEAYSVGFITKKSAGQVVRSGNTSDLIGSSCATKEQDCVTPLPKCYFERPRSTKDASCGRRDTSRFSKDDKKT